LKKPLRIGYKTGNYHQIKKEVKIKKRRKIPARTLDFCFFHPGFTPNISRMPTTANRVVRHPAHLFYCNLTWDTVAFREEVAELEKNLNTDVLYAIEKLPTDWDGESSFLDSGML